MTFVVMLWAASVVVASSSDVPVLVSVERSSEVVVSVDKPSEVVDEVVNGVEQSPCSPPSVE